ncbi:hypothetical protein HUN03_00775 [Mycoplasmopsis anatis]|nr:hypothetical protein [Mycoplasmopsis anatis]MBW0595041.1 hypothetical protein [Mycoplasmopsis anatis]MBW0595739.1 hypothetical protein [Mycoplasmopsis anatis]MBW0596611.1 hypothetical protein [Mycoplasmopsis anatis]MBW0597338.1 hypothetical protein [Mycoplasmopsis anatis]
MKKIIKSHYLIVLLLFINTVFIIIPKLNYSSTSNEHGVLFITYIYPFYFQNSVFAQFLFNIFTIVYLFYLFYVFVLILSRNKLKEKVYRIIFLTILILIYVTLLFFGILQIAFATLSINTILITIISTIIAILLLINLIKFY